MNDNYSRRLIFWHYWSIKDNAWLIDSILSESAGLIIHYIDKNVFSTLLPSWGQLDQYISYTMFWIFQGQQYNKRLITIYQYVLSHAVHVNNVSSSLRKR